MNLKSLLLPGSAIALFSLAGCVDDNYDLSNIDTTTELKVQNLTIPINIDKILLNDVIDINEDSKFKIITLDGREVYAFIQDGNFSSNAITIPSFKANAPELNPTYVDIPASGLIVSGPMQVPEIDLAGIVDPVDYNFDFKNLDPAIHNIWSIDANFTFAIDLSIDGLDGWLTDYSFRDLTFQLPKGMTVACEQGTYDYSTGVLSVSALNGVAGSDATIVVEASSLNFKENGLKVDYPNHACNFANSINLTSGFLNLAVDGNGSLPASKLSLNYNISAIDVQSVSGEIQYDIDGVDISPISLSDLPDFLTQDETNLLLKNPQIYLQLTNPVGNYNLDIQSGIDITATRGEQSVTYSMDAPGYFTINSDNGFGPYNLCLSPIMPTDVLSDFANSLSWYKFSQLSCIVGNGPVPDQLDIKLDNPNIPLQNVENFMLGTDIPGIENGKWEFFAPLNLDANSQIIYSGVENGWNDEDVDAITVSQLEVHGIVNSDIPCDIHLVVYPIDVAGNTINNVSVEGATVPANAQNYSLDVKITGAVTHLDGIRYIAYVDGEGKGDLGPQLSLDVNNIRVKVSGNFTKEL